MTLKKNKGITVISLVITIILLMILAGISIQAMTNTGIFGSARRAELENKRGQVTEYLSLKLLNQQMLNPTGAAEDIVTATRTSIVKKELEQIGKKVEIGEISKEENFKQVQVYFYVTVDEDIYKVEATGISFIGNKEEMSPVIKIVKMSNTTNSVTVEVETLYNEDGKLEYYIKGEQETDYKIIKTTTEKSYTFEGLEQEKQYSVKVKAIAKNKKTTEVIGQQTTGKVTTLKQGDVIFTYAPKTWTNESVKVTAAFKEGFTSNYTLKITEAAPSSTTNKQTALNWANASTGITVTTNKTVYAVLVDSEGQTGGAVTENVTNIDKLAPKDFTPTATSTTNSLTVTASTEDADETKENGKSEIAGYRFKLDSGDWINYQTSGTYTWKNLTQTTNHTITVEAKDNAGNTKQGTVSKGTGTVEKPTTATYTPTTWTNGNVTVTLPIKEGFTTRYTTDGTAPTKTSTAYSTPFTVSSNCVITYIYTDGTNIGGSNTANITIIDKLKPKDFAPTATSTTKSITVTASTTDADATTAYGKSGIAGYRFKLDSGNWTNYQTSGTYTWNNLAQSTNHTITVEAKDNAGNTKQGTVSKGTGTVEKPTTATYTPTGWTNGNVTVTLPTKQGYTTRYTTNGTTPTLTSTAYSGAFTVSNNCVITYIYTDGTNIGGSNTANIKNIDKTAPSSFTIAKSTVGVNSFTLSATFSDSNSGLGKIIWYYKRPQDSSWQSTTDTYTTQNSTTAGTTGSVTKTKSISGLTKGGTVQAYAIGYDVAGNSKTTTNVNSGSPLSFNTSTYTISYNANGGSGAPGSQSKYYGVNITLSSTKPTRSGYTFQGWSTSSTATSASYAVGASYSSNSNATLYAVWKEDWNGTIYESGAWKWTKFQSSFTRRWANNYNGGYYGTGVYSGTDYVGVAAASNGGVACTGVDVSTNEAFNSGDYRYINFECQPGNFAWGQYAYASLGVSTENTLTSDGSLTRVMTTTNLGWEASRTVQVAINTNTNYYIHFFCGNEYVTDGGNLNTALKVTKIWLSK